MWKCKHCSEQLEATFDNCWKCGYDRNGRPPQQGTEQVAEAALLSGELPSRLASSATDSRSSNKLSNIGAALRSRYSRAYDVARGYIILGATVKWVGLALALGDVVAGVAIRENSAIVFAAFATGGLIGVLSVGLGSAIAAQGQVLLAHLDTAVNTSPLLNKSEVASILLGGASDV